jgi:hypothetical protein
MTEMSGNRTTTDAEIMQLARILGKDEFFGCLSLVEREDLQALSPDRLNCVHDLVSKKVNTLTKTLVHEAMADDGIGTAAAAQAYLEGRLAYFGILLTDEQREQIRQGYTQITQNWG